MERKELTVTFEKTVQVKQYEPEKIGTSQTVALDEDDDLEEIREQLHDENVAFASREMVSRIAAKKMSDSRGE